MPSLPVGTRVGPYEVLGTLGVGGMGAVYRVRDTKLNRDVALKTLLPALAADADRLARLHREAQVLASFNHPNIAQIYGFEDSGDVRALVMELVPGRTLEEILSGTRHSASGPGVRGEPVPSAQGSVPVPEALSIARQIIAALEAAHEHGVIHRDLKPGNIKVNDDGTVKVLDFGLAKVLGPGPTSSEGGDSGAQPTMTSPAVTAVGVILGTAAYMSPEQARGRPVDKRSDIWAFGCVLYEMLTGARAFGGDNVTDVLAAVVRQEPDWTALPPDTPAAVRRVLERCLQKDPKQRLHDIADARLDIDAIDLKAQPARESIAPVRRRARGPAFVATAIAALIVGAAAGVWWRAGRDVAPPQWTAQRLPGPSVALHPRVSPDGHLLAFHALVNGLSQVAMMKAGIGSWTVVTHDRTRGLVNSVDWSPDGSRIYYDRFTDAPNGIYSVPAFGGEERLLIENASNPVSLKDGSLIFVRINAERQRQLHRFWPSTGRLEPLPVLIPNVAGERVLARPLRDGRVALVGRPVTGAEETNRLYALTLDTGEMRPIGPNVPIVGAFSMAIDPTDDSVLLTAREGSTFRLLRFAADSGAPPRSELTFLSQPLIDMDAKGALYVSLSDRWVEILRLRESGPVERLPTVPGLTGATVPLPDGRFLSMGRFGDGYRVLVLAPDKDPVVFVQTDADTQAPFTAIDAERAALLMGDRSAPDIGIVAIETGRILGRLKAPVGTTSLGASPDGKTLYAAANGRISALTLSGGETHPIGPGDSFTVDPDTGDLIVKLDERERFRLVRVSPSGGPPKPIEIKGDLRLIPEPLIPGSVRRGRLLLPVATPDSWFWFVGVLDLATGRLDRVPVDYQTDFHYVSWASDGRIVATGLGTQSGLWKFSPVPTGR